MNNSNPIYFTNRRNAKAPSKNLNLQNVLQNLLEKQQKFRTTIIPKTTDQALYLERLREAAKPPSVKMEEERIRKEKEQADLVKAAQVSPIDKLIAEFRAEREERLPPTSELEDKLRIASKTNPITKNLNRLFDLKREGSKKNVDKLLKLSRVDINKLIDDAIRQKKGIDDDFLRTLDQYAQTK
jgi:hypothetical protein